VIVADHFAMLEDDVSGRPYAKAKHRRGLLPLLNEWSRGSVAFKRQNITRRSVSLRSLKHDAQA
jgi:hypothetical protein